MKRWIPCNMELCKEHGNDIEILTDAVQLFADGICANDGDKCRCPEGCTGWMTADDGAFYANWDDTADDTAKAAQVWKEVAK